jgi:hypothetical protein
MMRWNDAISINHVSNQFIQDYVSDFSELYRNDSETLSIQYFRICQLVILVIHNGIMSYESYRSVIRVPTYTKHE